MAPRTVSRNLRGIWGNGLAAPRIPRSFEKVETDFFYCPPTGSPSRDEIGPRIRVAVFETRRKTIYPTGWCVRPLRGIAPRAGCPYDESLRAEAASITPLYAGKSPLLAVDHLFISSEFHEQRLRHLQRASATQQAQMPTILLSPVPFMDIATPQPRYTPVRACVNIILRSLDPIASVNRRSSLQGRALEYLCRCLRESFTI